MILPHDANPWPDGIFGKDRPAVFTGGAGKQRRRPCLCYANAYSQRIACAAARAANGPSASVMPAPIWLISAVARGLSSQPCNKLTTNAAFNGDIHKARPKQIAPYSWHPRQCCPSSSRPAQKSINKSIPSDRKDTSLTDCCALLSTRPSKNGR